MNRARLGHKGCLPRLSRIYRPCRRLAHDLRGQTGHMCTAGHVGRSWIGMQGCARVQHVTEGIKARMARAFWGKKWCKQREHACAPPVWPATCEGMRIHTTREGAKAGQGHKQRAAQQRAGDAAAPHPPFPQQSA